MRKSRERSEIRGGVLLLSHEAAAFPRTLHTQPYIMGPAPQNHGFSEDFGLRIVFLKPNPAAFAGNDEP